MCFILIYFRILANQLVSIFKKYPHLIMDQFSELLEFVGSIRNINDRQDFFMHVVCLIISHCLLLESDKRATFSYKGYIAVQLRVQILI